MQRKLEPVVRRFGIGEWYGQLIWEISPEERAAYSESALTEVRRQAPPCPFRRPVAGVPPPCHKRGGVCSLVRYERVHGDLGQPIAEPYRDLRCLCPSRFEEDDTVRSWIGRELLGTDSPLEVGEVPFLRPVFAEPRAGDEPGTSTTEDESATSVGRIDRVFVHPDANQMQWCAVEVQAVYFSGSAMAPEFRAVKDAAQRGIPFPSAIRRPDYRSSGPKRLMPQLQIKVPTLRRWGKKMAVVVDEAFFGSLGPMEAQASVSNADIAWFVVGFDAEAGRARLAPRRIVLTTLERAVEGLTAGRPVTQTEFESEIMRRLRSDPQ